MRENLFHGKRKDNGEWVEGCLLGSDVIVPKGQPFCICHDILDSALKVYEVIPETVGQYIERKDKNGTKIFEGDIVSCMTKYGGDIGIVTFKDGKFMVYWQSEYHYPKCKKITDYYYVNARTKVVGNIYDNPELIGGEVNG